MFNFNPCTTIHEFMYTCESSFMLVDWIRATLVVLNVMHDHAPVGCMPVHAIKEIAFKSDIL